jgi:hypothetical protein
VLSTTAKAQQRAKRAEKERAAKEAEAAAKNEGGDAMETEPTASAPATPGPSTTEKMDIGEDKEGKKESSEEEKKDGEGDKKKRVEKEKVGYEVSNLSRVLPEQLKYISFLEDGRYEPVKRVCFHLTFYMPQWRLTPRLFCSQLEVSYYSSTASQKRRSSLWRSRVENQQALLRPELQLELKPWLRRM